MIPLVEFADCYDRGVIGCFFRIEFSINFYSFIIPYKM